MSMPAHNIDKPRTGSGEVGPWVVRLLAIAVFINYVDRGILSTTAPLIKDELHISNTQIGLLLSAFFWAYTPSQLLAGWLTERISVYRALALGAAAWSLATAATGFVQGFAALFVLRLVLGVGESAALPCSSKILALHLPPHKLGSANGLIGAGLALGPAFGSYVGGLLTADLGWRTVFVIFGLASLLWLIPWHFSTHEVAVRVSSVARTPAPTVRTMLRHRELWGACLGHFSANWAFYFVITWLPLYLVKARGFTVTQMAELSGIVFMVYAASNLATGWVCDRWMAAGASSTRVRKTFCIVAHVGSAASMFTCAVGGPAASLAALLAAAVFFGFNTANIFAVAQTLGGPAAAGKWVGIQNCIGNLPGIIAPVLTGYIVDRTGQFSLAFLIAALVALLGVLGWGVVIRRVEPVAWPGLDSTSRG